MPSLDQLMRRVGPEMFVTDPDILARYNGDWMVAGDADQLPAAVARPGLTSEVADLLTACADLGFSVVPQGGRTGLAGGAVPGHGAIALSLERMCAIGPCDVAAGCVTVDAGATLAQVQQAAAQAGMMFALDIGSRDTCTIGGNIATNAGGNHVLKYGMARDLVLGLEVMLADGSVLTSLNTMLKNNAGFDLKHLFIGSEGTLGVITRAVLRLHAAPEQTNSALCALPDYDAVLQALQRMRSALGGELSTFEIMWPAFYAFASKVRTLAPLPAQDQFYLLVEQECSGDGRDKFEAALAGCLEDGLMRDVLLAQSSREAAEFWALRDSSGDLRRHFWPSANFDVSIPVADIDGFVTDLRGRLQQRWPDVRLIVFGHVADSNIHLVAEVDEDPFPGSEIDRIAYDTVGDFNGSVSAEHGIGTLKKLYLDRSRSSVEIAQMRGLKSLLDPGNILNPGKVFDMVDDAP